MIIMFIAQVYVINRMQATYKIMIMIVMHNYIMHNNHYKGIIFITILSSHTPKNIIHKMAIGSFFVVNFVNINFGSKNILTCYVIMIDLQVLNKMYTLHSFDTTMQYVNN